MSTNHRPATLEDLAFMLADYVVRQNRELLTEIRDLLMGHTEQLDQQAEILGVIVSNQEQLDQRAEFIATQVQEVLDEIQNLKNQPAAEQLDFSRLDAAIQPLADEVPDPEPTPEP